MSRPMVLPTPYNLDDMPAEYLQYDSQFQGRKESIGWKFWDTQTFISGTTTSLIQWMNTRATLDLGNMAIPYQLAAPNAFFLRAIRLFFKHRPGSVDQSATTVVQTGRLDNVAQIINTGVWTFKIGSKDYNQEPLWCLTGGAGAVGPLAVEGAEAVGVATDYAQNGVADPRAVNILAKPIFIRPGINFSGVMTWPAVITLAGGDVPLCILFEGDLVRPVQ